MQVVCCPAVVFNFYPHFQRNISLKSAANSDQFSSTASSSFTSHPHFVFVSSYGSGESAHMCIRTPEILLLTDVISIEISSTGPYLNV